MPSYKKAKKKLEHKVSFLIGLDNCGLLCVAYKLKIHLALAGVALWLEHQPAHQKVSGSIPSQGSISGCRFAPHPQTGNLWEATS